EFVLYVNGKEAGRGAGWQQATLLDVPLQAGANTLAIAATNQQGPAGLLGRLRVEFETGTPLVVDVDSTWKAANTERPGWMGPQADESGWVPAREIGRLGDQPWRQVAVAAGAAPSPYLRKEFSLPKPVRRARAYVTALGVYELRLNGRRVGREILAPGWTDYRKRVQYQTYDVTAMLRRGENAVGAVLGDGWFAGTLGFDGRRGHFGGGPLRLRCQINVEYADGSATSILSDGSWRGATGPIREADLYNGETYDARLEMPGWDEPGFVASADAWQPVA